jgi:hypothetical protein
MSALVGEAGSWLQRGQLLLGWRNLPVGHWLTYSVTSIFRIPAGSAALCVLTGSVVEPDTDARMGCLVPSPDLEILL